MFKYLGPDGGCVERKPEWHGKDVFTPYPVSKPLQLQRQLAEQAETVWVYDFIPLIDRALRQLW